MSLLWLESPLSILTTKKYLPPKTPSIIFENLDILIILSNYLEKDDLLDFLSVNKTTWSLKAKSLAIQNRILSFKLEVVTESYERIKNNNEHAAIQKRCRRNLTNGDQLPHLNIKSSLLYYNPFARIIKSNAKYFELTQEKKNLKNEEKRLDSFETSIASDRPEAMTHELNSLEEKLFLTKFGVYQNRQIPMNWNDVPKIPVKGIKKITPENEFLRNCKRKVNSLIENSLDELNFQREVLRIGILENELVTEPINNIYLGVKTFLQGFAEKEKKEGI